MPIKTLNLILKEIDKREKAEAYFHSISTARLAHIVVTGLGGEKAARSVKLHDLLPFNPKDIFDEHKTDCTDTTRFVIRKLIKSGRLPLFLVPLLRDEIGQ